MLHHRLGFQYPASQVTRSGTAINPPADRTATPQTPGLPNSARRAGRMPGRAAFSKTEMN